MTLSLPRFAYLPGHSHEPDAAPLEAAKALVPDRFAGCVPADHPAVRYGLALNDGGFHWEAHEVLEAVWKAAPMNGPDRLALQALIQIANAGLKRRMNRTQAARRLTSAADALLDELRTRRPAQRTGSIAAQLDVNALRAALARWSDSNPPRLRAAGLTEAVFDRSEQKCSNPPGFGFTGQSTCTIVQDKTKERLHGE